MDWSKYYPANWSAVTAEDVRMIREKKLAPVDKDAVKQDWDDRSDDDHVDIDKDGDEDNSDKFLHKKRKAITKAVGEDVGGGGVDMYDNKRKESEMRKKAREIGSSPETKKELKKAKTMGDFKALTGVREGIQISEPDQQDRDRADFYAGKDSPKRKPTPVKPKNPLPAGKTQQERDRDKWYAKKEERESWMPVDEKRLKQKKSLNKKDYRDDNLKKRVKGIEEPDFSKKQDTVTNMEWATKVFNNYHNIEEHCGWCDQGMEVESKELPTSKGIAKQIKELAKAVRGKDRLSIEGAASLVSKKDYDKLAPYLDKMSEDARQSILMVLMTDQKVANSVMKKMKTEGYDECVIPSHKFILEGMYKKYHELTWGEIGERLIKNTERRLVSLAYATKMGTIDAPSPEVQKLADECELEDLERASKEYIEDDTDITEVTQLTQTQKDMAKRKAAQTKNAATQTQSAGQVQTKADQQRTQQTGDADKDQQKRMDAEAKARAKKKAYQAKLSDDPSLKRGVATTTRGKWLGAIGAAIVSSHEPEGQQLEDQVPERLDARRRIFKEKIKKLAYEKAKEILGKRQPVEVDITNVLSKETNKNDKPDDGEGLDAVQPDAVKKKFKNRKDKDIDNDGDADDSDEFLHKKRKAVSKAIKKDDDENDSKVKENGKIDNKIKMEPEEEKMKESTGVAFVRKFKDKMNEVNNKEEGASLQDQILELFRSSYASIDGEPVGAEFAVSDEPASASTIARTLRCSPTEVQKLLDDMVQAGQITRVGDAYSYASPRAAEPMGVRINPTV